MVILSYFLSYFFLFLFQTGHIKYVAAILETIFTAYIFFLLPWLVIIVVYFSDLREKFVLVCLMCPINHLICDLTGQRVMDEGSYKQEVS